jgi:hypothetical protein
VAQGSGRGGQAQSHHNVRQLAAPEGAVNINMGTLVGSYAKIAAMLDEMAAVPNTGGVLLTFDDFLQGRRGFRHQGPAADEEPPEGLNLAQPQRLL